MKHLIGESYLVTTDDWFFAPDGEQYKAVWGTVNGIYDDKETLSIKTNDRSTNWYLSIGNMLIAGCQIHYAIKTDEVSIRPPMREIESNGNLYAEREQNTKIYNANN